MAGYIIAEEELSDLFCLENYLFQRNSTLKSCAGK
jgi:hypothetical protein